MAMKRLAWCVCIPLRRQVSTLRAPPCPSRALSRSSNPATPCHAHAQWNTCTTWAPCGWILSEVRAWHGRSRHVSNRHVPQQEVNGTVYEACKHHFIMGRLCCAPACPYPKGTAACRCTRAPPTLQPAPGAAPLAAHLLALVREGPGDAAARGLRQRDQQHLLPRTAQLAQRARAAQQIDGLRQRLCARRAATEDVRQALVQQACLHGTPASSTCGA